MSVTCNCELFLFSRNLIKNITYLLMNLETINYSLFFVKSSNYFCLTRGFINGNMFIIQRAFVMHVLNSPCRSKYRLYEMLILPIKWTQNEVKVNNKIQLGVLMELIHEIMQTQAVGHTCKSLFPK